MRLGGKYRVPLYTETLTLSWWEADVCDYPSVLRNLTSLSEFVGGGLPFTSENARNGRLA